MAESGAVDAATASPQAASPSPTAPAADPAAAAEELRRRTALGTLLVNMGAAPEEKVFGAAGSPAMQAYREHRMQELLVIHRPQDDAAAHPVSWYKPWTWWTGGAQVSPIVREVHHHHRVAGSGPTTAPAQTSDTTQTEQDAAAPAAAAAAGGAAIPADVLPAQETAKATAQPKRKRKGLPTVNMRPLTDDEVASLTPAVRAEREKLLRSEEHIHKTLQGIEDTRYRYLVPSRDLKCEAEVAAVVRCYAERNHTSAAAAAQTGSESNSGSGASSSKVGVAARRGGAEERPLVRADLLACGPHVQRLKTCAETMVMKYSHDGDVA